MDDNNLMTDRCDAGPGSCEAARESVAILLCTFNGADYLEEQLASICDQSHQNWVIYVSDDGSTDGTIGILEQFRQRLGSARLVVFKGPQRGFGKNFMSLVMNTSIKADYYAFCDQDDRWFADKLERSISALRGTLPSTPALYCSRTRLVDAQLRHIGYSPAFTKEPTFKNALVQSIAGANTMLINHSARTLLMAVDSRAVVVAHDWLTYLIVSGCNGYIHYDLAPTIDYRQHARNLIGANSSVLQRLKRISKMCTGRFRIWSDQNLEILSHFKSCLSSDSRLTLEQFEAARHSSLLKRLTLIKSSGIYRQTLQGNISLAVATLLNKI
ncbi:glycosyltransferase family 2 protein [Pseudomonas putida]